MQVQLSATDTKNNNRIMANEASEDDDKPSTSQYNGTPEENAWFFSKLFFIWETPLFKRATELGKKAEPLQLEDLLALPSFDHGDLIGSTFEEAWDKQADVPAPKSKSNGLEDIKNNTDLSTTRLRKSLTVVIGRRFIKAGFVKALNTCIQFSFPLLLNALLKFIQETTNGQIDENDDWHVRYRGYWLSAILLFAMASKAVTENTYFHLVIRSGYQARVAVSIAVYNKSLRLTNAERQSTTLGELINLMQVDATKIEMFIPQFHVLWDGALQIIGYMAILYSLIGWPCFAGMGVMLCAGPVQAVVMGKLFGLNRQMVKHTDARVESTNEGLQGIQCVKMYTWEESLAKAINKNREDELGFLKKVAYLRGFSRAYMGALPGIVAVCSFAVFAVAKSDADISAATLFSALVAFDQLRFPLLFYPVSLAQLAQAKVSAARVELFLRLKEVGPGGSIGSGQYTRNEDAKGEIVVKDATVFWDDPNEPIDVTEHEGGSTHTMPSIAEDASSVASSAAEDPQVRYPKAALKNATLRISPGELCAVVGRVASGKSTLCSAVLNEALLESGDITLNGKVAYAAQSPWILNATLRDNIIFGLPMDQAKYDRVIQACQLEHDLTMFDDGDLTEIGERGINLSGGQKARVSIARAAYSDADTIILDDPLSALDPEVGKLLFEECILDLMEGKTRLFVTNQIQFLRFCDTVVALKRGEVVEHGTFTDLVANENGEVKRLLADSSSGQQASQSKTKTSGEESGSGDGKKAAPKVADNKAKTLTTKEEQMIGGVSTLVYKNYLKAGGGYLKFGLVYSGFVLACLNTIATTSWISYWTSDADYENHSQAFYLGFFFMLAVTLGLVTFVRSFLLVRFGIDASETLHRNLLNSIMRAPQSFFDTTPLGRILSRFSKDFYSIDVELADFFDFFLFTSLQVIFVLASVVYVTPWFAIAILPMGVIYFRILNFFREVARSTKRLDSISRSPVYAHFSETLGGLSTIRAYGQPSRFVTDFGRKIDSNTRAYYNNKAADRWLSVRLELIGATCASLAAVFATNAAISRGTDDPDFASLAGLSLTFSISMTSLLSWCVRSFAQLEASMNACERVLYYTDSIPQEAPYTSEELESRASSEGTPPSTDPSAFALAAAGGKAEIVPANWPSKGEIVLKNLRMRYRPETPLVLKGLNVTISAGERIGIVGRTGSGKSSLLLTLLRLVEPSLEEGKETYEAPISIDGVDVLRIGLKDLRSRMGIIPQNPVLFSGTIRSNMDPFDQYSDEEIWAALDKCGLKGSVDEMPGQLGATVSEYGQNLSSGMRQMLVMGRALLRQCRILLLDEATSSVDFETDQEIQRTLREAFPGCTVLTIAHRIDTIMDSDKILVMKDGVAHEFGPPQDLLSDKKSTFSEIVRHAETKND